MFGLFVFPTMISSPAIFGGGGGDGGGDGDQERVHDNAVGTSETKLSGLIIGVQFLSNYTLVNPSKRKSAPKNRSCLSKKTKNTRTKKGSLV